jgi:hypothetical protein
LTDREEHAAAGSNVLPAFLRKRPDAAGLPQVQLVIWSMALWPARISSAHAIRLQYSVIYRNQEALAHALVVDRLVFITLTMTALGFVALVIWTVCFRP